MRKPNWLPEGARKAFNKNKEDLGLVAYKAPKGNVRRYIASEVEQKIYRAIFAKAK